MKLTNKYLALAAFLLLSLILYFPTYDYGMVSDFLGWMHKYRQGSWSDVPTVFGYPGLHQFFHLVNFGFYQIFALNHFSWYVFFAVLHGLNAYIIFLVFLRLTSIFQVRRNYWAALLAVAVFLVSPYQVEPVTWKACLHYLLSSGLHFASFYYLLVWYQKGYRLQYFVHLAFFVSALFTLEINLASPFIYLLIFGAIAYFKKSTSFLYQYLGKVFSLHVLLIIGYFLLNKWILGSYVGHYGAEQHLNFSPDLIISNGLKYLHKYGLLLHFLPYSLKHPIYHATTQWYYMFPLVIGIAVSLYFLMRKRNGQQILMAVGLLAFFMGIFPIVNLYFVDVMIFENDRYGYFASPYFYLFVGILCASFSRKWWKWIGIAYFFLHLIILGKMITYSWEASEIYHSLLDDYRWGPDDDVYILASPENYQGMYLFRNYDAQGTSLKRALEILKNKETGSITDIAQYNMHDIEDGVNVIQKDGKFKVMQDGHGNWFWRKGLGLTQYETDQYSVEPNGWFYWLDITDNSLQNAILLTSHSGKWVIVNQ